MTEQTTSTPSIPTPAALLTFEAAHTRDTGAKESAIRHELGLSPARYYQLLGRLIWTETALAADPVLVNRLRRQARTTHETYNRRLTTP